MGRVISSVVVLFLLVDGIAKVLKFGPVLEACARLDVPEWTIPWLGGVLIAATLLHAAPPTAVLGALLLTGYLGGAVWTHLRVGGPAFPVAFPILLGAILWLGLCLREPRLRDLIPVCRGPRRPGRMESR
ncbi:DoxX family protein [Aquisphaera insulae]|uniref:DoxX family protein n=1 Tax=Aquisphaera insulae TaxID=2712864 RepID=UPI0020306D7B|nr:DoxX family protein [Aquisphaera insulae]